MPVDAGRAIGVLILVAAASAAAPPSDRPPPVPPPGALFLCPAGTPPPEATVIHRYRDRLLVSLPEGGAPMPGRTGLRRLDDPTTIGFRSFSTEVGTRDVPPPATRDGLVVLAFAGPPDPGWRRSIEECGLEWLAPAHPYAVVARSDGDALRCSFRITTSEGFRAIRTAVPLPLEARAARSLWESLATGAGTGATPDAYGFPSRPGRAPDRIPLDGPLRSEPRFDVLLARRPDVAYVQSPLQAVPHLNLVVGRDVVAAAPVWDQLGLTGEGIVVAHNDTGVDLDHPDLAPDAVVASVGVMRYTDTGHGTHTAATIVGRGGATPPFNDSGCGDVGTARPAVLGIAHGAVLATNNRFEGGLEEIPDMMAWAVSHGASVSSNSWGFVGSGGAGFAYSVEAVEVDAAVRSSGPGGGPEAPLTVVFSAGNLGPGSGTVSTPSTAKNAITVGATQNDRCGSWVPGHDDGPDPDRVLSTSSRGPAQGRIKPDLVAAGADLLAAGSGDPYATNLWDQEWTGDRYDLATGTSQAAAVVAGGAALVTERLWRSTGVMPSPAAVKATLVAGAVDLGLPAADQGWGRLDLERSLLGPPGGSVSVLDQDRTAALGTGASWRRTVEVLSPGAPLTVVLVWTDVPGEADAAHPLVNDLDLVVATPSGVTFRGNLLDGSWSSPDPGAAADGDNNVEVVRVDGPEVGTWTLEVVAASVPSPPSGLDGQDFAIAISGDAAPCRAPEPPAAVTARPAGPRRVELVWSAVPEAAWYRVRRAGWPSGSPFVPVARVDAPQTSWIDDDVDGGVEHRWVVEAVVDDACASDPSPAAVATPTGECLAAPTFDGLATARPTAVVTCGIELGWPPATTPCPGTVAYDVYRTSEAGPVVAPENLLATVVDDTGLVDHDVADGGAFRYAVRARNPRSGRTDDNTAVGTATARGPDTVWLDGEPEHAPAALETEVASAADGGSAPWSPSTEDAVTGETSWACTSGEVVTDQALITPRQLVLPVGEEVELWFQHRTALDPGRDGGRLEYSTDGGHRWHDILAGDGFAVPADPARLLAGGYDDRLGGGSPLAGANAWTGHSHRWNAVRVDLAAFAGRPVLLRWRCAGAGPASDPGGWWLDEIRIHTPSACQTCPAPDPPTGVAATATEDGVLAEWRSAAGGDAHTVERDDAAGGPLTMIAAVSSGTERYLDRSASGGSLYRYAIRSWRDGCRSELSETVEEVAEGACTLAPEFGGLVVADAPEAERCVVELLWRPATSRCDGRPPAYRIYRTRDPYLDPRSAPLRADSLRRNAFSDVLVRPGETYRYLVRAHHAGGSAEDLNLRVMAAAPRGLPHVAFTDGAEQAAGPWIMVPGSGADPGTEPWHRSDTDAHDGGWSLFVAGEDNVKDQTLVTDRPILLPSAVEPVLEFWHLYDHQVFVDGGRLEYSTDSGATWHDILDGDGGSVGADPDRFLAGGYSGTIQGGVNTPIGPGRAWTGFIRDWSVVTVDLAAFAGTEVSFRWRIGCNSSRAGAGWWVDDVVIRWPTPCEPRPDPPRTPGNRTP